MTWIGGTKSGALHSGSNGVITYLGMSVLVIAELMRHGLCLVPRVRLNPFGLEWAGLWDLPPPPLRVTSFHSTDLPVYPPARDENWAEEVKVDEEDLKVVWFVVDHFHSLKGLAHTYLTFEFGCGTCLSFSFETRREKGERYHPWDGLWRAYELYLLVGFERDVTGLRTHGGRQGLHFRPSLPRRKELCLE